jgi:hypothetical protein
LVHHYPAIPLRTGGAARPPASRSTSEPRAMERSSRPHEDGHILLVHLAGLSRRRQRGSGDSLAHEPEPGSARLAPMLRSDCSAGGDDVACVHDSLALAGGTAPLVSFGQRAGKGRSRGRRHDDDLAHIQDALLDLNPCTANAASRRCPSARRRPGRGPRGPSARPGKRDNRAREAPGAGAWSWKGLPTALGGLHGGDATGESVLFQRLYKRLGNLGVPEAAIGLFA